MKKFFIFSLLFILVLRQFSFGGSALAVSEGASAAPLSSYSDKEDAVRDILNALLDGGDDVFAESSWWQVCASWVRSHLGDLIAGIAGIVTLIGSLLVLLKTNPRFKRSIDDFKVTCGGWFKVISDGFNSVSISCDEFKAAADKTADDVNALKDAMLIMIDSYEDVIKLSGADEGKKELYIGKLERAKAELRDEK